MTANDWIDDLFGAIDSKDADGFMAFLGDAPSFRFGNAPPVLGREAIREVVAGFFSAIQAVQHSLHDTWQVGDAAICRGEVCYTRHDGSLYEAPFANVFKLEDGRVRDYQIYVDVSGLFAPA